MASGALMVGGHLPRVGLHSMHANTRSCQSLLRPHIAVLPITTLNRATKPSFRSVSLLVEAGANKKDKLKKHRKGGVTLPAHKALGQGGESVLLNVSARLTPEEIWDREEARWDREEARWLREEQRWVKEESRWEREREQWSQEEAQLRNHIEALRATLAEAQLEADARADAVRQSLQRESAQAQIIGQAALEAQLSSDAQLATTVARWREEEQALLAEVDALKTALAEVLNEANAKAEAARKSWQKHEAALQAEIAQLKHSLLEVQAVTQARGAAKTAKPAKDERPSKAQKEETKVPPMPSAEEIIAAVASRTPTKRPEVKGVFKSTLSNGAASNGAPPISPAPLTPPKSAAAGTPPTSGANPAPSRTLRYGAEGADVKAVQEELVRLGFYCGEEEMDADAYEDGTDSAVKSWQCSVGVREDGVLTPELQALLLGLAFEKAVPAEGQTAVSEAPVLQQKDRKVESERYARTTAEGNEKGSTRRVYLLGENRWEEPDRLVPANAKVFAAGMQKCFACKGEGKVMCTECEGTGDMNVEEQFLSWAGEDPHCPYCGGSGSTDCDSCQGTGVEAVLIR